MKHWLSVDDVLDFAISREQEAVDFYTDLSGRVAAPAMKQVFEQFAKEERGHKLRLEAIKADRGLAPVEQKVLDLKMSDYLVDVEPTDNMSNQDALILAMKREKAAYKLYLHLADAVAGKGENSTAEEKALRGTFLMLAQQEAQHKLRFEIEYDDQELQEN